MPVAFQMGIINSVIQWVTEGHVACVPCAASQTWIRLACDASHDVRRPSRESHHVNPM